MRARTQDSELRIMADLKPLSLMQRRRQELQRLGPLAPQFSLALEFGAGNSDVYRVLPFRRNWIVIAVAAAFLLAFSIPLVSVSGPFFDDPDDSLFSLVFLLFSGFWLLGWSTGVMVLLLVFLAVTFGRETLRVEGDRLILRLGIPGLGFGASYNAALLRNFRTAAASTGDGNSWRGEHLAFDYGGEAIHFGSALSGEHASEILQVLRGRFPLHAAALPDPPAPPAPTAREPLVPGETRAASPVAAPSPRGVATLALVVANLIPLGGVLLDGWSIGEIMLLFWAESAVIGFYNLCKMWLVGRWAVLFYGPFFTGHYGAFMAGHLLFIYGFFVAGIAEDTDVSTGEVLTDFLRLWPALLGFFISHGVSFVVNYLGRQEYRQRTMSSQMGEPYKRIIIMHVTIIFGGFLVLLFGTPLPALMLLILLKMLADLRGHLREHAGATA